MSENEKKSVEVMTSTDNNKTILNGIELLTPKKIVEQLDMYIIGQKSAKKAVAIALRNRTRRLKLTEDIRDEVAPKNILMIGPTGVGKTEIARRLAKLCNAPFLKVEATKYTEVGYVGRDVESMIRDLMAVGYNDVKHEMEENLRAGTGPKVEEKLLDLLVPGSRKKATNNSLAIGNIFHQTDSKPISDENNTQESSENKNTMVETREKFREMLRLGKLEDREVEIAVKQNTNIGNMGIIAGGSMEDLENGIQNIANMFNGPKIKHRKVTIKEARRIITEETLDSMIDPDKAAQEAKNRVEQSGIIFIDEIDKVAVHGESHGQDVSREGVQRDILPIVEGSNVNTKFGVIDTTHILFIAAGAFSVAAPSDLIPELQGRFPLRVELDSLKHDDFRQILSEPKNALTKQYKALLKTEDVSIEFKSEALDRISKLAEDVNNRSENIGARRLHTIMEKLLEDISFDADAHKGETVVIDSAYVDEKLTGLVADQDLSRYIL